MKRNDKLIKSKFYKYLLPGIMMVAALQLGNLVDSIFVGNLLGTDALSAINIGMPVVQVAQIPILMLAIGGSIVAAVCLGKRENDKASWVYSLSMAVSLFFNIIIAVLGYFFSEKLAVILTGNSELMSMTRDFMLVYLLGMPILGMGLMLSYFMGVDNHPFESSALHIVANVVNLVTDYIYIKVFGIGMIGSALSTVTGYGIAALIFGLVYYRSKNRTLKLDITASFAHVSLLLEAAKNGMSAVAIQILAAVKMFVLNAAVLKLTGNKGMAVYAICVNSFFLVLLFLHGISGVIQTLCGVLFGENDYYGIRTVLKGVIRISALVASGLVLCFMIWPGMIEGMFGFTLIEEKALMDVCLRVYALSFIAYAANNILQTYYSTIEKPFLATLNTVLQGFLILIPASLICLDIMGVLGTSVGAVIAETGSFLITLIIVKVMQRKRQLMGRSLDILPEKQAERFVDITVEGSTRSASEVAHRFRQFCLDEGYSMHIANIVAMAGEELVYLISGQNPDARSYIDICLIKEGDKLLLRLRDDGPLFNPMAEDCGEAGDDLDDISEICIIKKMASNIEYSRVLNMNNTTVII